MVGSWAVDAVRQNLLFNNNTYSVPVHYESGSMHFAWGKSGAFNVTETNFRLGGKGADGHLYERVSTSSGSTTYVVHGDGTITYGSAYLSPGTDTSYVDHVLQWSGTQDEIVGTLDNYKCVGNNLHTSGRDYMGGIYALDFHRLS